MRALVAAVLLVPVLAGCSAPPVPTPPSLPQPSPTPAAPAGLSDAAILAAARAFNGSAAFEVARAQVEHFALTNATCKQDAPELKYCSEPLFGVPGTPGNDERAALIAEALRAAPGWSVRYDNFTATFEGKPLRGHNVVGERAGRTNATLYFLAHYDSRPCADEDANLANRTKPVLGANDGASGVAVMLELARLLPARMNLTLRFVFDDAEDLGDSGHGCGRGTAWAQGAEHYAAALTAQDVRNAKGLVLLDLVGDKDLQLRREARSAAPPQRALQDALWTWAAKLGHAQFRDEAGGGIEDDHVPFLQRGVPSVDVIHLCADVCPGGRDVFPESHHTAHDDLAHLSPASLEAVGQTALATVLARDADAGRDGGLK